MHVSRLMVLALVRNRSREQYVKLWVLKHHVMLRDLDVDVISFREQQSIYRVFNNYCCFQL